MQTAPWSPPWISSLDLRFREPVIEDNLPFSLLPLFQCVAFVFSCDTGPTRRVQGRHV